MLLLVVLAFGYEIVVARRLTDNAYDHAISGVVEGLAMTLERDEDNDLRLHFASMMQMLRRIDAPDAWRYVVLDHGGRVVDGDASLATAAQPDSARNPSFRTATLRDRPERVATYRYEGHNGPATIVVAQTLLRREAETSRLVDATLWPNVALMALSILLTLACVRIALRPLDRLGAHLDAQGADTLASFPTHDVPSEIVPLVQAIDGLVERLRGAARLQQTFLDHAAHQLRTPLAVMRARIELLNDSPPEEVARQLGSLHASVVRLSHVTRQLLMLGRTDRGASAAARTPIDVAERISAIAAALDSVRARGGCIWLSSCRRFRFSASVGCSRRRSPTWSTTPSSIRRPAASSPCDALLAHPLFRDKGIWRSRTKAPAFPRRTASVSSSHSPASTRAGKA
jgi:signal transduction histidine kinase